MWIRWRSLWILVDKTCTTCGQSKPLTAFARSRNTADGHADVCKDCRTESGKRMARSHKAQGQRRVFDRKRKELYRLLGGQCACAGCLGCGPDGCGSKQEPLHLDHIDWRLKTMEVLQRQLSLSRPDVRKELENVQLLCEPCHIEKTKQDSLEQKNEAALLAQRNEDNEWLKHEREKRGRKARG